MRSINTSLIALLPVAGLLFAGAGLLGAGTLKDLALVLFVGLAAGAYSLDVPGHPDRRRPQGARAGAQALRKRVLARRAAAARAGAARGAGRRARWPAPAAPGGGRAPRVGGRRRRARGAARAPRRRRPRSSRRRPCGRAGTRRHRGTAPGRRPQRPGKPGAAGGKKRR